MDSFSGTFGVFGLGWLLIIIFWIIILLGIFTLIRWLAGHGKGCGCGGYRCRCGREMGRYPWQEKEGMMGEREMKKNEEYVGILKERYAKGEINKEEFEQKKKDLM